MYGDRPYFSQRDGGQGRGYQSRGGYHRGGRGGRGGGHFGYDGGAGAHPHSHRGGLRPTHPGGWRRASSDAGTPRTTLDPAYQAEVGAAQREWSARAISVLGERPPPTVVVLRGASGGGKSSLARLLAGRVDAGAARICSADAYFYLNDANEYRFDPQLLGEAHAYCRAGFDAALRDRAPLIILDNTSTTRREYAPYAAAVASFNEAVAEGRVVGVPLRPTAFRGVHDTVEREAGWHQPPRYDGRIGGGSYGGWAAAGFMSAEAHYASTQQRPPAPTPQGTHLARHRWDGGGSERYGHGGGNRYGGGGGGA
jgi:hypothetical protein